MNVANSTIDTAETEKFNALAGKWWDTTGPFKPLHEFNPIRLQFLKQLICDHYLRDADSLTPFNNLAIADIGCGGGLIAEPIARLGATVTAIDAAPDNIGAASAHAEMAGVTVDYRHTTAEELAATDAKFDVVLALEIVEHVADVALFTKSCAAMVKPGGLLVMATINRTAKSLLFAKIGAEYILRLLPKGTHDWRKFPTPSELSQQITQSNAGENSSSGLQVKQFQGFTYLPFTRRWKMSDDLSMNYLVVGQRGDS